MQLRKPPPHHRGSYINLYINPIPAAYTHHNLPGCPGDGTFPSWASFQLCPRPKSHRKSLKPQHNRRKPHPHVCFARGKPESRGDVAGGGAARGSGSILPAACPVLPSQDECLEGWLRSLTEVASSKVVCKAGQHQASATHLPEGWGPVPPELGGC